MRKKTYLSTISIIFITIICLTALLLLAGCKKNNATDESANGTTESGEHFVSAPDAEAYYEENAKIVDVVDVNKSKDVQTEAESYEELVNRGFNQYAVSSSYSMDGDYSDAADISESSAEKHPIYETYYFTKSGDLWTIFVINGVTMANPVSYNLQSGLNVQVIVSESDTIMSYDSTTNKFFETIPDASALIVVTVERIDAETLETLTIEEIDSYVK